MKLKFLSLLFVLLVSCSEDDTAPLNVEKDLASTITYSYSMDGNISGRIENYFQSNKLSQSLVYNGNSISIKNIYEYGNDGQISLLKRYDMFGNLSSTLNYYYDANGRILQSVLNMTEGDTQTTNYSYNNDNTITKTVTLSSGTILNQYVFHIDGLGKAYKITEGDNTIQEVGYEGDNVIWLTYGSITMNFSHDENHEVKGEFLNVRKNLMNLHGLNYILDGGFLSIIDGEDKYMIHQIDENGQNEQSFQYDFDADGYPIEKRIYLDGTTQPNKVIEINYQ